ncbi:hypothetical protein CRYUN_Cryun09bG0082600 [Craigia yunnanensis]
MATTSSGMRPAQRAERQNITQQQQGLSHGGHSLTRSLNNGQQSLRSKDTKPPPSSSSSSRRSVTPTSRSNSRDFDDDNDPGRVRVAVRLRPRNADDLHSDADFADCVELQQELKRLKLRENNWSSESYKFDEVFTETASQKRVYEVVAKPVVESVLSGYNGTVMAYGQTGTGKTFTLGKLGKDDASERGIMLRALEDIMANKSVASGTVEVSYLQLYMESIQDLLAPEKTNIPINEHPKTGEVSLPGAVTVKIRDLDHFLELLQIGGANRHAANTKLNTESSRSHAILMVYIRRSVPEKVEEDISSQDKKTKSNLPVVRKSKLLIVDLSGSERLDKSGSEGLLLEEAKFINLSLTSLGKCINALAENSPHIPMRDSKLTRLLRDSFGGSARTSLIITIGPSSRHHAETTSTIMFGQRAMKIVNVVKLKEEFDYESLCRKLETQVDHLTAEIDRQQKLKERDIYDLEKQLQECQDSSYETRKNLVTRSEFLEKENIRLELDMKGILAELNCQKDHNSLMQDKISDLEMSLKQSKQHQLENSTNQKVLADTTQMYEKKIAELIKQLEVERAPSESAEEQIDAMKKLSGDYQKLIQQHEMETSKYQKALAETTQMYKKKIMELTKQLEDDHTRFEAAQEQLDLANKLRTDYQKSMKVKLLPQILIFVNQEKIVEEGGLDALLTMLISSQNATILRVASGAIANLAMNEMNQGLIMSRGGVQLLAKTASKTDDPQTLRMVAGALANLCGNEKLHTMLKEDRGIKALLGMVRSGNNDVVAQVARGMANFAKCELRAIVQGHRKGCSLLMEDGALEWLIANCNTASASTRRHVELALCHLAQNEDNAKDFTSSGGLQELQRISMESSREDICNLAKKMLKSNTMFQDEMRSGWQ